jgi:hypothetical protein
MSIQKTSPVNNTHYPEPKYKETLKFIAGVTQQYEAEKALFTSNNLEEAIKNLDMQKTRRETSPDRLYVKPSDIKANSEDKKIARLIQELNGFKTEKAPDLKNRVTVQ